MLIKRVYLKNIRSYAEADFYFSPNTTIIQGPVGVGKTTLLMAVSFALFGNSLERGVLSGLLKKDAIIGMVVIEIEHLSHTYTISRTIERKKEKITQSDAYIIDSNKKIRLSPTELNARISALLNIKNISNSSSIFYIAQDKIKQILYANEEERMNMIRAIFNIKKYHQCKENEKYIEHNIEQEISLLKKDVERLNEIKKQKSTLEQEKENLEIERKKQEASTAKLKQLISEYSAKYEDLLKNIENIEKNKQQLLNLNKNKEFLEKNKENIKNNISALSEKIKQMNDAQRTMLTEIDTKTAENIVLLKTKLDEILQQKDKTNQQIVQFQTIFEETEKQKNKLFVETELYKKIKNETEKKITELQSYIKKSEEKYFILFGEKGDLEKIKKIPALKEKFQKESDNLQRERDILKEKKQKMDAELKNLEKQKKEILDARAVCPVCESPLPDDKKTSLLRNIANNTEEISREIKDILLKIKEKDIEIIDKNKQIKGIEEINSELFAAKYNEEKESNMNSEEIKNKIKNAENENREINEKQKWLQIQIAQKQQKVIDLTKDEKEVSEKIEKNKNIDSLAEKIKILEEQKEKEEQRYKEISDEIKKTTESYYVVMSVLQSVSPSIDEDLKKSQKEKTAMQKEMEEAQYHLGKIEQRGADIKKDVEKIKKDEIYLEMQKKIKEQKEQILYWVNNIFIKMLNTIETKVTEEILKNFEDLFKKYFKTIMQNTDFSVEIDEKFTPTFYNGDSVFSFEDLSGGEKTAAALSYHITLAVLLEKYGVSALKGILILDEPTTGFGTEQIQNMQQLLSLLPLKQIIIVSHESGLEKSAQHVIKLCKTNGQSYVVC